MARLSGNTLRTVRFYEQSGLLSPVDRTDGGHRLFSESELEKLELISKLRAAGLALEEIKQLLETKARSQSGGPAARELTRRLEAQIRATSERIDVLERVKEELEATRQRLAGCSECRDNELFPDACHRCRVMTDGEEVPAATRVLWNMER